MDKALLPLDALTNENTNTLLAPVVVPSFVVDRSGTLPLLVAVPSTAPTGKGTARVHCALRLVNTSCLFDKAPVGSCRCSWSG